MITIKFDKSVKYQGVRYAAHEAFKVADEDVAELKKAGATILSTEPVPPLVDPVNQDDEDDAGSQEQEADEDVAELKEKLLEYTVPELIEFAQERGIDLQKKTRKAEIYNIIVAALN